MVNPGEGERRPERSHSRRRLRLGAAWLLPVGAAVALVVTLRGTPGKASGTGVQVGMRAPGFRAPTLGGRALSLAALRGHPVVLDFFTSWCAACRAEAPSLEALFRQEGGRVFVVGVDMAVSEPSLTAVSAFAQTYGITFPIILDRTGQVSDTYQIQTIPTLVFVDASGIVRGTASGDLSYSQIATGIVPYVKGAA